MNFLAYAETPDQSGSAVMIWLLFAGIAIAVFILGFLVVGLAWKRNHRQAELILGATVVWGLLTAVSVVWAGMQRMKWEKDQTMLLSTGYLDPANSTNEPAWPVGLLVVMGIAYVGLLGFAMSQKNEGETTESTQENRNKD